jgi:peptidyl-prolyl cis-trans isomerase SurA
MTRLSLPRLVLSAGMLFAAAAIAQPAKSAATAKPATTGGAKPAAGAKPATAKPKPNPSQGGQTIATVGTIAIKKGRVDTLAQLMARARGVDLGALPPEQALMLRRLVVTNLIGQELVEMEAKNAGVQATPRETDSALALLKSQFPSVAEWQAAMRRNGDTEAGLRAKISRQLRADKTLALAVQPPGPPTDDEVRAFWEKNRKEFPTHDSLRALQILLLADAKMPADSAVAKKRDLENLRRALTRDSAEVTTLLREFMGAAARYGEGPEARLGGDLERFHPDDFNAEFKKQVGALRVGQMSPVFRSPLGFHLVMLIEKYDGKFDSYRLQSLQNLMTQKSMRTAMDMREFLRKLAAKYPVKFVQPAYRDTSESRIY